MQDKWSQYWEKDAQRQYEVFAGAEGEKPEYICTFWRSQFAKIAAGANCLDIASGAGSVYADIAEPQRESLGLHACDVSLVALQKLQERIASVSTIQADAANLPFTEEKFDAVVSQFGIEYAGGSGFHEAFRVLKPEGGLYALCHAKGSVIDAQNARLLHSVELLRDSGFLDVAVRLVNAQYSKSAKRLARAKRDFIEPEKMLSDSFKAGHLEGIHSYTYFGFKQMYTNLSKYHKQDVIGWLHGMGEELRHNRGRLKTMQKACMDENTLRKLQSEAKDSVMLEWQPFYSEPKDDEKASQVAWSVWAKKKPE